MPRNGLTQKRKNPCQDRSRATVDAILAAAARVLVADGLENTTTNRIAELAGVSIGSLYQYFPNKQAIARALLERHFARAEALRPAALRGPDRLALRERLRIAVEWQLAVHAEDPPLHQTLTRIAPMVLEPELIEAIEQLMQRTLRFILQLYVEELPGRDLDLAAFIVANCMESLTHGATVHHPDLLDHPELATEITDLLAGYLGA
jgi:AcrR family transcriptional regulator